MDIQPLNWYSLSEEERIKQVYTKYSINDFWNWWANNEQKVMEVRIKDYNLIKQVAHQLKMPFSPSGIYVWNNLMLKLVMREVRDKATIWMGINPRKVNWNKYGKKSFGGTDYNIRQIDILFIDIDRVKKDEVAASFRDLENCDKLANLILDRLSTQGWNKNYLKICSGNGVQLLVKLDVSIRIPDIEYVTTNTGGHYIESEQFDKIRKLIPEGIGKDIIKFSKKYKDELGVQVDKSCFNIGRVGALPFTKNYKYDGFTYRGIIELKNESNIGFTDYILSKEDDIKTYKQMAVFPTKAVKLTDKININKIEDHILVKYMLENDLPKGMRNNYLWFSLKCLLRDSGIDFNSEQFRQMHRKLEQKHKTNFPSNIPEARFGFDENIVNKYFMVNLLPPIYPIYSHRTKKLNMLLDNIKWEDINALYIGNTTKIEGSDIIEDIKSFRKMLKENDYFNKEKFSSFIKSCISIYGEDITKYYFDYVMPKLLWYE